MGSKRTLSKDLSDEIIPVVWLHWLNCLQKNYNWIKLQLNLSKFVISMWWYALCNIHYIHFAEKGTNEQCFWKYDHPQGHTTYMKSKASSCINISITQSEIHLTLTMAELSEASDSSCSALSDYCTLSFTLQITLQGYLGYYRETYGSKKPSALFYIIEQKVLALNFWL